MSHGRYRDGRNGKSGEDSEDSEEIDVDMREYREDRKDRDDSTRERSRSRSPAKSQRRLPRDEPSKSHHRYGPFDKIYDDLFIKIRTQRSFPKDHDSIVEYIVGEYKTIAEKKSLSIANTVLSNCGSDRTKYAPYLEELVNYWLNSNDKNYFGKTKITLEQSEVRQLKEDILIILNTKIEEQIAIEIEKQKQQQQFDKLVTDLEYFGTAKGVKAKYNNTYRRHKKTRRHHYKKTHRRRYRK